MSHAESYCVNLGSDKSISERIFICVTGRKIFLISILILICPIRTCQIFENQSIDKAFMAKVNIEICISKGDN